MATQDIIARQYNETYDFSKKFYIELLKHFPLGSPTGKQIYSQIDFDLDIEEQIKEGERINNENSYIIYNKFRSFIICNKNHIAYTINTNICDNKEVLQFIYHMNDAEIMDGDKFTLSFYKKLVGVFGILNIKINMIDVLIHFGLVESIFPRVVLGDIYDEKKYGNEVDIGSITINDTLYYCLIDIETNKKYLVKLFQDGNIFYGYYYPSVEEFKKNNTDILFEYIETLPVNKIKYSGRYDTNLEIIRTFEYSDKNSDSDKILYKIHIRYGTIAILDDYTFKIDFDSQESKQVFSNIINKTPLGDTIYGKFKYNNIVDSPLYWRKCPIFKEIITEFYLKNENLKLFSIDIDLPYKIDNCFKIEILYPRIQIEENLKLIILGKKKLEDCCKFTQEYINSPLQLDQLSKKYNLSIHDILF